MKSRWQLIATVTLVTSHLSLAQTALTPTVQAPAGSTAPGPGQITVLVAPQPGGGSVRVMRDVQGGMFGYNVRVVASGAGDPKSYNLANVLVHTIGILDSQISYWQKSDSGFAAHVLNLETGKESPLKLDLMPRTVASRQGKVVMLGNSGNATAMAILDSNLSVSLQKTPALAAVSLGSCLLSFNSAGQVLLVDRAEAAYWPIDLAPTVSVGARVALIGSDVDLSRQKTEASKQQVRSVAPIKTAILLAHLKAQSGNDLFFLSPYKVTEGFRLAEFDRQGRQIKTYLLTGPEAARGALTLMDSTVGVTADRLEVVSLDGTKRTYERP